MLTITKTNTPHIVTDAEGKRTHYLGEVHMKIADRPAQKPTKEEVKNV